MQGTSLLIASLLYGSRLRLQECLEIRVKDIDFERLGRWIENIPMRPRNGGGNSCFRPVVSAAIRGTVRRRAITCMNLSFSGRWRVRPGARGSPSE
jgi:integrase